MKIELRPFIICLAMLAGALLIAGCGDASEPSMGQPQDMTLPDSDWETDADSDADADSDTSACSGTTIRVPGDCRTIQEAVDQATPDSYSTMQANTTIILTNGVYYENVVIPPLVSIAIICENGAVAIIDGGADSAITMDHGSALRLQEITIVSKQTDRYSRFPTILANMSRSLILESVQVFTSAKAIAALSTDDLTILRSTISGNMSSDGGTGVALIDQTKGSYAFILENKFENLYQGILTCSNPVGPAPLLSLIRYEDSNQYEDVTYPLDACPWTEQ
ncbi:MAG: hypothetical protein WCT40_03265 [Candidatus Magasanikbacteria bacterium]